MSQRYSVGIYPGTFDPVHEGHVAFCLKALELEGLERIVFLPERQPREKQQVTALEHRLAMIHLAVKDHAKLEVLTLPVAQFTVAKTLPELTKRYGDNLTLLLGSDVAATFTHRWPGLETLLDTVQLLIALRKDDTIEALAAIIRQLDRPVRYRCILSPQTHAASTLVRQKQKRHFLHPQVNYYISQNKLYSKSALDYDPSLATIRQQNKRAEES